MNKITIGIITYNKAHLVRETILSCLEQDYPNKEILVIDNASSDHTQAVLKALPVRNVRNAINNGIGYGLVQLMNICKGKYIVYMCDDDVFTCPQVVSDIVEIFDKNPTVGVIGHYFYQYMNGYQGAVFVSRDKHIIRSSCNPSGIAYRKDNYEATNDLFIENPYIVKQALKKWDYAFMEYDTVAVRLHEGGNAATTYSYFDQKPNQSQTENWYKILGFPHIYYQYLAQLKNRYPKMLWREICVMIHIKPTVLLSPLFWFYTLTSLFVPSSVLRKLSNFYRHRLTRNFVKEIKRNNEKKQISYHFNKLQ